MELTSCNIAIIVSAVALLVALFVGVAFYSYRSTRLPPGTY